MDRRLPAGSLSASSLSSAILSTVAGWKPAVRWGFTCLGASTRPECCDATRRLAISRLPSHCDQAGLTQHIVISMVGASSGIEANFGLQLLSNDSAAELMESALLHFDGQRYRLAAWCVMPNHVHVVVEQIEGWPLDRVVHAWKSYVANGINKIHGRTGRVWHREYFDRFMRDDDHLSTTIYYVENNPVDAGLVERATDWKWSSARHR